MYGPISMNSGKIKMIFQHKIHDIELHVKHICHKCEKKCVKEKGEGIECEKRMFEPDLSIEPGGEHNNDRQT